jgi:hypothetical protein
MIKRRQAPTPSVAGVGVGVDAFGMPVIDPTKNVLDAVASEGRYQDGMREAGEKLQNALREEESKFQTALREAETRRINELAAQKQTFDLELAKVLRANQDAASTLLATQLKEVKNDLSDRTAKLEQFRWESGGKTTGASNLAGWIVAAIMALIAVAGPVVVVLSSHVPR